MKPVYINKASIFMPNDPVNNDDMESILGMVGERLSRAKKLILRSNGIKNRYYALDRHTRLPSHSNAQLAAEAIRKLADQNFDIKNIQTLSCATTIADQIMPGHGVMVHGELKELSTCEVITTAGVCLCGVTAIKYAWLSVLSGQTQNAVACASETASFVMQAQNYSAEVEAKANLLGERPEIAFEKDFLRWMLSDGAGALLLENKPRYNAIALKIEWIDIFSYADEMDVCMYAGAEKQSDGSLQSWTSVSASIRADKSFFAVKQDVKLLNDNIVNVTLGRSLATIIEKYQLKADDIDYFLPHYSSEYFREPMHIKMNELGFHIPYQKWFTNLITKGNTGSASIFIIIEELLNSGALKGGEKILCFIPESGRFSASFMLLQAEKN